MTQSCCGQMHFNTGYQRECMPLLDTFLAAFEGAEMTSLRDSAKFLVVQAWENSPLAEASVLGFEWTTQTLGHINVWFSQEWTDPLSTGSLTSCASRSRWPGWRWSPSRHCCSGSPPTTMPVSPRRKTANWWSSGWNHRATESAIGRL